MASLFWSDPHPPPPKVGSSAAKKWIPSAKLMSKSFRQKLRFGGGQFFCHANLVSYSCEQQSAATDKRSLPTKCKSTTSKWYHTLFSFARQKYRVGKGWFEYTTKHYNPWVEKYSCFFRFVMSSPRFGLWPVGLRVTVYYSILVTNTSIRLPPEKRMDTHICCKIFKAYILGYPTGYSQHNTPNKW